MLKERQPNRAAIIAGNKEKKSDYYNLSSSLVTRRLNSCLVRMSYKHNKSFGKDTLQERSAGT